MNAKIKPKANFDRVKLEDVLPLKTPFSIFIDPSSACNFKCKFCPTSDRELIKSIGRKPIGMDLNLYQKIMMDILEFDEPIKNLKLYKEGEPLLNKNFSKMVSLAKKNSKILKVDTTTNASLLNPEKNLEIIDAGLDRINISIEGMSSEQYMQVAGVKIDFKTMINNIEHFYLNKQQCEVNIKIPNNWLSKEDKDLFFDIFSPICDKIFIENISNIWPEYDMNNITIDEEFKVFGEKKIDIDVCPFVFYAIAINSDGSISACCVDWERKLIVGDVTKHNIKDVWQGEGMKKLQIMHLKKDRYSHPVCGKCDTPKSCSLDNIDNVAYDILQRF